MYLEEVEHAARTSQSISDWLAARHKFTYLEN